MNVGALVVGVHEGFHLHQIDNPAEVGFAADGNLNRSGIGAQAIANLVVNLEEVRSRAIHLVDEDDARHLVAIGLPPHGFRLGLNATDGAEDRDHAVEHSHGTLHLNCEVHVTGSIDNIDLMVLPGRTDCSGSDGNSPLPLLSHPVCYGRSFMDFSHFVNDAGIEQNALCCGGFSSIDMCCDADVTYSFERDCSCHSYLLVFLPLLMLLWIVFLSVLKAIGNRQVAHKTQLRLRRCLLMGRIFDKTILSTRTSRFLLHLNII